MMEKDRLFLLPPGFEDNERREFCPECAELWGVLSYYPAIRESLEICYVGIHHPREEIVEVLGDGNWNAPTMVLAAPDSVTGDFQTGTSNGVTYLDSARQIAKYFAAKFGTAMPRGS
ncbi:MAG: DUF3088 family protein [Henriciella sp.]|jgi:hypothetical protein|mmetsp:Transcript_11600/g.14972  ORF Transcript_11600/g.14972 Transcript_11600/m.14972 type:complete len:117 (+) Transcript_11600:87-437(+)